MDITLASYNVRARIAAANYDSSLDWAPGYRVIKESVDRIGDMKDGDVNFIWLHGWCGPRDRIRFFVKFGEHIAVAQVPNCRQIYEKYQYPSGIHGVDTDINEYCMRQIALGNFVLKRHSS